MQYDDKKALNEALRRCALLYQENTLLCAVVAERDEEIVRLKAAALPAATPAPQADGASS